MTLGTADGAVRLRPATPEDRQGLLSVYASTRAEDLALAPWTEVEKEAFVRTQFDAQDRYYRQTFPRAEYNVIVLDGRLVGRLYLDRRTDEIRIVDISLLPTVRNRGIGTRLITVVFSEADNDGLAVRLHVDAGSRARGLYERLGFSAVGETAVHVFLERACTPGR